MPGNASDNPDHPSPCSVLEPPFDEDDIMHASFGHIKPSSRGTHNLLTISARIGHSILNSVSQFHLKMIN